MVIMLHTMQSKVDRFFIGGKIFLLLSDSTVLVINPRTYKQIHSPIVVQGGWMDPPPWGVTGTIIANPSFYSDIRRFGWPSYTLVVVISVWLCCLTGYVLRMMQKIMF